MSGNVVVGCIGSSHPLIREYVHDFGLCTIDMTHVEQALRDHLAMRAFSRAEWQHAKDGSTGIKATKLAKIDDKYSEMTLGTLIREFERQGAGPELVGLLRRVNKGRRDLLHNHLPITDPEIEQITSARIQEVRVQLHGLRDLAQAAFHAIQDEDLKVFRVIAERMQQEGQPEDESFGRMKLMLARYEQMLGGRTVG